jgi:hypothetical protein
MKNNNVTTTSATIENIKYEALMFCRRKIDRSKYALDESIIPAICAGNVIGSGTLEALMINQINITIHHNIMENIDRLQEWAEDTQQLILENRFAANRSTCAISNAYEAQTRETLCEALSSIKGILSLAE